MQTTSQKDDSLDFKFTNKKKTRKSEKESWTKAKKPINIPPSNVALVKEGEENEMQGVKKFFGGYEIDDGIFYSDLRLRSDYQRWVKKQNNASQAGATEIVDLTPKNTRSPKIKAVEYIINDDFKIRSSLYVYCGQDNYFKTFPRVFFCRRLGNGRSLDATCELKDLDSIIKGLKKIRELNVDFFTVGKKKTGSERAPTQEKKNA